MLSFKKIKASALARGTVLCLRDVLSRPQHWLIVVSWTICVRGCEHRHGCTNGDIQLECFYLVANHDDSPALDVSRYLAEPSFASHIRVFDWSEAVEECLNPHEITRHYPIGPMAHWGL